MRISRRRFAVAAFVFGLAAAALAATAGATIIATTPAAVKVTPPPSVMFDQYESNTEIRVFDEQQCVTLLRDVRVDITQPGTYDELSDLTNSGFIPAGTRVSSHFMHVDKVGTLAGPRPFSITLEGSMTTDTDILGIAVLQRSLDESDFLGALGTLYPTGDFGRRVELDNAQSDFIIEQPDVRTVVLHAQVAQHADQVRVITKCAEVTGGEGCTPGYWKQSQHFDSWEGYSPSQTYQSVFGVTTFGSKTLLQVLKQGGGGANALGRLSVAALLAAANPDVAFPMTSTDVINQTKAALLSGDKDTIESLKDELDAFANLGCPIS
jgi:hypothetical protein